MSKHDEQIAAAEKLTIEQIKAAKYSVPPVWVYVNLLKKLQSQQARELDQIKVQELETEIDRVDEIIQHIYQL
jgi:hypothetical protein